MRSRGLLVVVRAPTEVTKPGTFKALVMKERFGGRTGDECGGYERSQTRKTGSSCRETRYVKGEGSWFIGSGE
jgi:hypothetical protein